MSTSSSGVRPGSSRTSTVAPGSGWARHQSAMSFTAASMCPWAFHFGSNIGDLLGIRT